MIRNDEEGRRRLSTIMSLVRSFDVFTRYIDAELKKHGSNLIRFEVMNALYLHDGTMTPTVISRWVFRAKHTLTPILHLLEREGLIRREPNARDGRSVVIYVTGHGMSDSTNHMIPIACEISQKALSCLNEEQIETLTSILKQVRKHLLQQVGSR